MRRRGSGLFFCCDEVLEEEEEEDEAEGLQMCVGRFCRRDSREANAVWKGHRKAAA